MRVETLDADDTVADLVALARRSGFSRFPVHNGDPDTVLGVVHVKQAFGVPVAERGTTELRGLVQQVPTVPESLDGDALLTSLRESGLQLAVVVDEYGGTAGIVTLEDLVEEIVGDVRDEHDRAEQAQVRPLGRDSWLVSGLLRDHEVAEATGFRMPSGRLRDAGRAGAGRAGPDPGRRGERRRGRLAAHRDAPRPAPGGRAAAGPARADRRPHRPPGDAGRAASDARPRDREEAARG